MLQIFYRDLKPFKKVTSHPLKYALSLVPILEERRQGLDSVST